MNQDQNNVPVDDTLNNQQVAEQSLRNENQEIREYYLRQLQLMCPTIAADKSDNARLAILRLRTARLTEMLTLFEHSWTEEVPVIQKAVLQYLATEDTSKKERQKIIESWTNWSDFQFKLTRYRGLLTQFLQYHHRTRQELESLSNNTGTSAKQQEIGEQGGV